ncbi:MAG: SDR family NAD(P)-dependent oxidoreductase [Chloroflexota bacterium]
MRLQDRVAIITGGANGIGRASVRLFAQEGAAVAIADLDRARAEELVAELAATGARVAYEHCDLTNSQSVKAMVEAVLARFGRIDVLVNCAGGSGLSAYYKTEEGRAQKWTEETPEHEWEATLALNLTAPFYCIKHALPHMKQQGRGTIVNFGSIGAFTGQPNASFGYAPYAAAKAGINGLTRQLAKELGPFGITVNCIAPGAVLSERMLARWQTDPHWKEEGDRRVQQQTPLRRRAAPEEVAAAVLFLATDEAAFITGATLDVNGGSYMR